MNDATMLTLTIASTLAYVQAGGCDKTTLEMQLRDILHFAKKLEAKATK